MVGKRDGLITNSGGAGEDIARHFGELIPSTNTTVEIGLDTIALEGFGATDAYAIGRLGPENARDAAGHIDRPEVEIIRGGRPQFPDAGISGRPKEPAGLEDRSSLALWTECVWLPGQDSNLRPSD